MLHPSDVACLLTTVLKQSQKRQITLTLTYNVLESCVPQTDALRLLRSLPDEFLGTELHLFYSGPPVKHTWEQC